MSLRETCTSLFLQPGPSRAWLRELAACPDSQLECRGKAVRHSGAADRFLVGPAEKAVRGQGLRTPPLSVIC